MSEMRESFRARRDILLDGLRAMGIKCVKPQGAFYAFPAVEDEDAPRKLLEKGVIVTPGSAFGEKGKGHIRISYATSTENLRKALGVMEGVLR